MSKKQPTMKDVSIEAGVALGTVSKVFNGIPVGEEYKRKVEEAALKLGYQVNQYARGLRASKTFAIALVVPNLNDPFYASLVEYCCEILQEKGYKTILSTTAFDPNTEQECVDMVMQNKVDGIIAITYNPNLVVPDNFPFVIIDRKFKNKVPCVAADNFGGGHLAAEKLVENGCKHLLFLGISSSITGEADKRSIGFSAFCDENHISYDLCRSIDDEGIEKIFDFIDKKIEEGSFSYDGIFVNSDSQAIQVMEHLKEKGFRIPQDIQLIGFDGITKIGTGGYYCSTIKQPLRQMAETCVDILINKDALSAPALVCLPIEYCYGGTTLK